MRRVLNFGIVAVVAFVIGVFAGANASFDNRYLAGRLSACTQIVKMDPILALAQVTCIPHNGDVALQVGDKLYSLDGKQLN